MNRKQVRASILAASIAAVAATAWATTNTSESTTAVEERTLAAETQYRAAESLAPNETVVVTEEASVAATEERPVAARQDVAVEATREVEVAQPGIVIEERRLGADERLQLAVMDALAAAPNLSGSIGVESENAIVRLSGYTMTAAQMQRAERTAARVEGVRQVVNEIRPRIGAITS